MSYQTIETTERDGVARIWLNRPEVRNAMNDVMIGELAQALDAAIAAPSARVILLGGHGKAFCAGADLNWMKRGRDMTPEESHADSVRLARLLRRMYESPKPVVARVHGPAFAGAMGLVAACDIAIASTEAKFCLSEVKLGLIPAMISPYVIRAMGEKQARRLFLTAEVFDAAHAARIGYVHEAVEPAELDARVDAVLAMLLAGGPKAMAECKRLIRDVVGQPIDDALADETAARIAAARGSDEGQEGIASFFEKRRPSWVIEPGTSARD